MNDLKSGQSDIVMGNVVPLRDEITILKGKIAELENQNKLLRKKLRRALDMF